MATLIGRDEKTDFSKPANGSCCRSLKDADVWCANKVFDVSEELGEGSICMVCIEEYSSLIILKNTNNNYKKCFYIVKKGNKLNYTNDLAFKNIAITFKMDNEYFKGLVDLLYDITSK